MDHFKSGGFTEQWSTSPAELLHDSLKVKVYQANLVLHPRDGKRSVVSHT